MARVGSSRRVTQEDPPHILNIRYEILAFKIWSETTENPTH